MQEGYTMMETTVGAKIWLTASSKVLNAFFEIIALSTGVQEIGVT